MGVSCNSARRLLLVDCFTRILSSDSNFAKLHTNYLIPSHRPKNNWNLLILGKNLWPQVVTGVIFGEFKRFKKIIRSK